MKKKDMWLTAGALWAVAAAGFLLRSEYEREQLSVEKTVIESKKIGKNCTMVFLSDLHNHEFGSGNNRLLEAIDQVNPDLVLIGGDMMVSRENAETSVPLMLIKRLARHYPVYYGNGNHENRMCREVSVYGKLYEEYVHNLQEMGVLILSNRSEIFRNDIAITGIDLEERYYRKLTPAVLTPEVIKKKAGKAAEDRFQILLCHSPLYFCACRAWGADLTLSGHFHGGTIRLPLLGGVMTPQYQFFLPCCAGEFEKGGKRIIVSRGLGTHSINVRINNKPQLLVIELKKKN